MPAAGVKPAAAQPSRAAPGWRSDRQRRAKVWTARPQKIWPRATRLE
eukprot:CAMPEP_0117552308 /NCGR_PEP_ID=MMETSP0784-20121206/49638_1 /TAXON_ID=39447 /ORGANISM="" /LENGTH=46 /DNA_ID= /DNA_START= /DNA_END= /DNA_ORIENTATION=